MARHPEIARALGVVRPVLEAAGLTGKTVLVACSGGRDSVALAGLLDCLRHALSLDLCLGHVDHRLRPESGAEAEGVRALAQQLGVGYAARTLSLDDGPNLAERARLARRGALEAMASDQGAAGIALGHTATDQAETVLMNLTRGSGLTGLCGMRASEPPYLRPILELTRVDTRALCQHLQLSFVDDPTNDLENAARIRIRSRVLPELEAQNPRAVMAIAGAAQRLQDVEVEIERASERAYLALRTPTGIRVAEPDFSTLAAAVRGRVVRRALAEQGVAEAPAATVAAIESGLLEQAWARVGRGPEGGARPRSFHLRPSKRVAVDRRGLSVSSHAKDDGPNH